MLVGTLVDALQIAELTATLVPAVVGALQSELTVALVPAAVVRVHLRRKQGDVPPKPYFEVICCNLSCQGTRNVPNTDPRNVF